MIFKTIYQTPHGQILIYSDGEALTGLYTAFWGGEKERPNADKDGIEIPCIRQAIHWLDIYFAGEIPDFVPAINPQGTMFQKMVWDILLTIPYGKLMTYGEVAQKAAKQLGKTKMSAQAIGNAVGVNPISLIIPCHRVIGANGNLTGYGGGLKVKLDLLKLEKIDTSKLIMPKKSRFL